MKRRILGVLLSGLLVISFAGCGGSQTPAPADDKESDTTGETTKDKKEESVTPEAVEETGGKTITIAMYNQWYDAGIQAAFAKYEEKTGNKVEVEVIPDDQYETLMQTKVATGEVPDIGVTNSGTWTNTEYLQTASVTLEGDWIKDISEEMLPGCKTPAGELILAPYGPRNVLGFYYNKKVLEDAGVTLPLKNYDELKAACEKIKASGVTPICLPNQDNWTVQIAILGSFNEPFFADATLADKIMTNQIKPSEVEGFVTQLNRIIELKAAGYVNEDCNSTTFQAAEELVAEGECAMAPGGDWLYSDFMEDYPDQVDNIGYMPLGMGDQCEAIINSISKSFVVFKDGKQVDAALDFVNDFMTDQDIIQALYELTPGMPPLSTWDVPMNDWVAEVKNFAETNDLMVVSQFELFNLPDFSTGPYNDSIQKMLQDDWTAEQTLDDWYDTYVNLNKAEGREGF